jgi:hypothetical protein
MQVQKNVIYSSNGEIYTSKTLEYINEFNKVKPFTANERPELERVLLYIRPELFVDLRDIRLCIEEEVKRNMQIVSAKANVDFITDFISMIRFTLLVIPVKENVFVFQKGI